MNILPVPIAVSQNQDLLPDGGIDRAHASDCGEACLASIFSSISRVHLPVGCLREALGKPETLGNTLPEELCDLLIVLGRQAVVGNRNGYELLQCLLRLRHYGRYGILLGDWLTKGFGHWVLAYERDMQHVWVMEPWSGTHAAYHVDFITERSWGAQVWVC